MLKQLCSTILVINIGFCSAGWMAMALGLRTMARYEAACRTHQGKQLRLELTGGSGDPVLAWEHAGEFQYLGQMYDVVTTYDSSGVTIINAEHDGFESEVMDAIKLVLENSGLDDFGRQLELMYQIQGFIPRYNMPVVQPCLLFLTVIPSGCRLPMSHMSIDDPPPKVAV